jgi:hypothetical protein
MYGLTKAKCTHPEDHFVVCEGTYHGRYAFRRINVGASGQLERVPFNLPPPAELSKRTELAMKRVTEKQKARQP